MSKVTPSRRRTLSVAAGTVGLAAVGAAATAGQACAAESGLPGLAGGGLPLSTNALSVVKGLVSHDPGSLTGVPIAGLPLLGQVPAVLDAAAPAEKVVPGLLGADFGRPRASAQAPALLSTAELAGPAGPARTALNPTTLAGQALAQPGGLMRPQTRGRLAEPAKKGAGHTTARPVAKAPAAAPAHAAAVAAASAATPAPVAAPLPQTPFPTAAPLPAMAPPKAAGPLDGVTGALPINLPLAGIEQSLPLSGQLTGPGRSLPVVGGLTGGLPLLGSSAGSGGPLDSLPIAGLTGSLSHLAG